jgi:hypothetical protein
VRMHLSRLGQRTYICPVRFMLPFQLLFDPGESLSEVCMGSGRVLELRRETGRMSLR